MIAKRVDIKPEDHMHIASHAARKAGRIHCDPAVTFDDQMAEGALSLLRAVQTYNPDIAEFSTHASRVARNRLIDQARKSINHRARLVCETDYGTLPERVEQPDRAQAPEVEYETATRVLMSVLDKQHFAVVTLKIEQDLSFSQIGSAMGIGKTRAHSLFLTAISQMRAEAKRLKLKMEDIL